MNWLPARGTASAVGAVLLLAAAMLGGCTPSVDDRPVEASVADAESESGELPVPALTREDASGRASAAGTLVYRRDRGGFFALADLVPGAEPSPSARLVVVLVQSDGSRQAPDLVPLVGAYCTFSGTLREETSMSALPELAFESYRVHSADSAPRP